jgi:hypothetical protein
MANRRPGRGGQRTSAPRRAARSGRVKHLVVPLDAEDIAMARLQAQLRKAEAIRAPNRRGGTTLSRTTLRLPRETLQHARDRARRERTSLSAVVQAALARYLKIA